MVKFKEDNIGGIGKGTNASFWVEKTAEDQLKERACKLQEEEEIWRLEKDIEDTIEAGKWEREHFPSQERQV